MIVEIEYIKFLDLEMRNINNKPLQDIEFYEKGKRVIIDKKIMDDFKFLGFSNMKFILTGFYKSRTGNNGTAKRKYKAHY